MLPATYLRCTQIYSLSLHDALPISNPQSNGTGNPYADRFLVLYSKIMNKTNGYWSLHGVCYHFMIIGLLLNCNIPHGDSSNQDRKSTRLNSSHPSISYAVFCLKKTT